MARKKHTSDHEGTVLITGASSGLGLAIARQVIETSHRVILTAREASLSRFKKLGIKESKKVRIRALDVTKSAERRRIVTEAQSDWDGIDVLINNAGVAFRSVVEHVNEAERLQQMDINFRSPIDLARLVLPGMRKKRAGRIINISSVGGMMAMPTMAAYSASKFALEGATEALWYEVRPWNIKVSMVEPGFIHSSSFERTLYTTQSGNSILDPEDPYHAHYKSMGGFIRRLMLHSKATPERVAKVVMKTLQARNPHLRVPATFDAHVFALLRRFLPRRLYHACLYRALPQISTWGPQPDTSAPSAPKEATSSPSGDEEFSHP